MGPKKKNAYPSVNPQLYEKSMKPAMTIAMGMKPSHDAASCWRAQVENEERIHTNWTRKYNSNEEKKSLKALERTLQREKERHEAYQKDNDALQKTLYRKDAVNPRGTAALYLKSRKELSPQEKYPKPQTSAQEVGWGVPSAMKGESHLILSRSANPEGRNYHLTTAAYRRPDDRDHAELFGYTLDCSN